MALNKTPVPPTPPTHFHTTQTSHPRNHLSDQPPHDNPLYHQPYLQQQPRAVEQTQQPPLVPWQLPPPGSQPIVALTSLASVEDRNTDRESAAITVAATNADSHALDTMIGAVPVPRTGMPDGQLNILQSPEPVALGKPSGGSRTSNQSTGSSKQSRASVGNGAVCEEAQLQSAQGGKDRSGGGGGDSRGGRASAPKNQDKDKDKMHECETCGKKFAHKGHFNRHRRSHGGDANRRYTCGECGFSFFQASHLASHIQHIHSARHGRVHECTLCHLRVASVDVLRAHLRDVHHIVLPRSQSSSDSAPASGSGPGGVGMISQSMYQSSPAMADAEGSRSCYVRE
jgi:hypothetical protein